MVVVYCVIIDWDYKIDLELKTKKITSLQMDKKDLLSSSISPSGGASRSERGEMSPSSLHSSHSSGSSQSIGAL